MHDKARIASGFQLLRGNGYLASGRAGFTRQDGYHHLLEQEPNTKHYVFYTTQGDAEAFDGNGNLRGTLYLYWAGDAQIVAAAFRDRGLMCDVPDPSSALALLPNPEATATTFESVCEAAARRYGRLTGRPLIRRRSTTSSATRPRYFARGSHKSSLRSSNCSRWTATFVHWTISMNAMWALDFPT